MRDPELGSSFAVQAAPLFQDFSKQYIRYSTTPS